MALTFPASPTNGDKVILAGREFEFASPSRWRRLNSIVYDGGFSSTNITLDLYKVDGGDADGI